MKRSYEELRHALDTEMLQASGLAAGEARQDFVTRTFIILEQDYRANRFDHDTYMKLVNRLADYAGGAYNDYLDMLVGAATMDMLDIVLAQEGNLAEQARKRSQAVTDLTGVQPVRPEE